MGITSDQVKLSSGPVESLYILAGTDDYSKSAMETKIENRLRKDSDSCDVVVLDATQTDARSVMYEASNPGLFAERTLMIVRRADSLLSEESFIDFLRDFTKKDGPNVLVIETQASTAKIRKLRPVKMDLPYENQLPGWITGQFRSNGKSITDDAANLLALLCGRNLLSLSSEIDKILTAYPDEKRYGFEHVSEIAGPHKKDVIFGYLDALLEGNQKKASLLLTELLHFKTEPVQIVGMIRWRVQQMITARYYMDRGIGEANIIKKMKLSPYLYRGFCSKLRKYPIRKLLAGYDLLHKTDLQIKNSTQDKAVLLQMFTLKFLTC